MPDPFPGRIIQPNAGSPAIHEVVVALKGARAAQGLSLADIRDRTGMARSALSRIENDIPNLTVKTLERYAEAVGKKIVSYIPGFPGAHSQGETLDQLNENLREVIAMLLEDGEPRLEAEFFA